MNITREIVFCTPGSLILCGIQGFTKVGSNKRFVKGKAMITLRDYAKQKGITYEAVRRQVNRYNPELTGHISIRNRTQYLDDWAVEFLSERRRQSPIVIVNEDRQEEIEQLKQQVAELQEKLSKATEQAMASEKASVAMERKLIDVQYENIELQKKALLIEIIETQKNKADEALEAVKQI